MDIKSRPPLFVTPGKYNAKLPASHNRVSDEAFVAETILYYMDHIFSYACGHGSF